MYLLFSHLLLFAYDVTVASSDCDLQHSLGQFAAERETVRMEVSISLDLTQTEYYPCVVEYIEHLTGSGIKSIPAVTEQKNVFVLQVSLQRLFNKSENSPVCPPIGTSFLLSQQSSICRCV